jgi:hypothetical protein
VACDTDSANDAAATLTARNERVGITANPLPSDLGDHKEDVGIFGIDVLRAASLLRFGSLRWRPAKDRERLRPLIATWCESDAFFGGVRTYCHCFFGIGDPSTPAFSQFAKPEDQALFGPRMPSSPFHHIAPGSPPIDAMMRIPN